MGLFEHFPYTNYHDLNLDKILERTKEAEEAVAASEAAVLAAAADMAAADAKATLALSTANTAAGNASSALTAAGNAVSTANSADAKADTAIAQSNPYSVIPQVGVRINFNDSSLEWYEEPGGADNPISTLADLIGYLSEYTNNDFVSGLNPILIKPIISRYPRLAHPTTATTSCYGAQLIYTSSPLDANYKGCMLIFYILIETGDLYRIILSVDPADITSFTYTDAKIN